MLPARCVAFQLKITLAWLPPILPRTRGRATCTCMPAAAYPTKWRPGATINNNNILSLRNLFECKAYAAQAARSDCYLGHDAKIQRGKFVTQLTHTRAHTRTLTQRGHSHICKAVRESQILYLIFVYFKRERERFLKRALIQFYFYFHRF